MYELLSNIDSLLENHFKYKLKRVIWRDEKTEEFVNNKVEEITESVYDYVFENLFSAEKDIDEAIEKMESEWEDNPLSRKDFNVFMLRNKKDGG